MMYLQLVRNLNLTALLICIHYCALSYRLRHLLELLPPGLGGLVPPLRPPSGVLVVGISTVTEALGLVPSAN